MLLVDAANVIASRPTGWWRDRPGAARRFVEQVRKATADGRLDSPVVVVLEGEARRGVDEGVVDGVEVVHAPHVGDDRLAALALAARDPVVLVTADRGLRERVASCTVRVVGPTWLYDRLEPSAAPSRGPSDGGDVQATAAATRAPKGGRSTRRSSRRRP